VYEGQCVLERNEWKESKKGSVFALDTMRIVKRPKPEVHRKRASAKLLVRRRRGENVESDECSKRNDKADNDTEITERQKELTKRREIGKVFMSEIVKHASTARVTSHIARSPRLARNSENVCSS
jgi:hypothetical protein